MESIPIKSVAVAFPSSTILFNLEVASSCTDSGTMIDGIVVSITETFCVAVAKFPAASVAVQVIK